MESPPHTVFLEQYKFASGEGAVVELKLRLLADKIPSLQKFAHVQRLEDIENEIAQYFGKTLSDKDKNTLALCRQLRNKILHCNFSVARQKLAELGTESPSGGVKKVDLAALNHAQVQSKAEKAIAGNPDTFVYVSDSPTTNAASVFGWLLEVGASGDLIAAVKSFREAAAIVDQLAVAEGSNA